MARSPYSSAVGVGARHGERRRDLLTLGVQDVPQPAVLVDGLTRNHARRHVEVVGVEGVAAVGELDRCRRGGEACSPEMSRCPLPTCTGPALSRGGHCSTQPSFRQALRVGVSGTKSYRVLPPPVARMGPCRGVLQRESERGIGRRRGGQRRDARTAARAEDQCQADDGCRAPEGSEAQHRPPHDPATGMLLPSSQLMEASASVVVQFGPCG